MRESVAVCVYTNTALAAMLSLYLFVVPAVMVVRDLGDPELRGEGVPRCAFRWHRALSPKYERWARQRVTSGTEADLTTRDIAGTEWPLFGSVFYLWATEALEETAAKQPKRCPVPPSHYARGAIEAAAALAFGAMIALVPLLAALILPWQRKRPTDNTTPTDQEPTQ